MFEFRFDLIFEAKLHNIDNKKLMIIDLILTNVHY